MIEFEEIGHVQSPYTEAADPFEMREHESVIVVRDDYVDGLYRIEENTALTVLFHFHRAEGYDLIGKRYHGEEKGVFASRSPRRPAGIGVSTVKLLRRKGGKLRVRGLDAIDGTPVLDIKPYAAVYDREPGAPPVRAVRNSGVVSTAAPRRISADGAADAAPTNANEASRGVANTEHSILSPVQEKAELILRGRRRELLEMAAGIHGHFCPGVALGVIAAESGLRRLAKYRRASIDTLLGSEGMEELLAIVEINSCFADGVQVVTGCTFGNNSLIYRDLGKTAVTLCDRTGTGIRIRTQRQFRSILDEKSPRFRELFERVVTYNDRDPETVRRFKEASREASHTLIDTPPDMLIESEEIELSIPDYAPIRNSHTCASCGESVMDGKAVHRGSDVFCVMCAGDEYATIDGAGIHCPVGKR